jgi:hypothetical protein
LPVIDISHLGVHVKQERAFIDDFVSLDLDSLDVLALSYEQTG